MTPSGYPAIGDDVAIAPVRGGKVVVKVDMLVESTDIPPGMSYRQAARKAVAACVSDFASKGVMPESFLVSIGLRKRTSPAKITQLASGFRDAEDEWAIRLIGGDTNEARELVIDCAMVGFADKIVERRGASVDDVLVVTGPFGHQSAGLRILIDGAKAEKKFRARAIDSVLNPKPDLRVGIALAPFLSSGMDSSDGLARSLHTLAKASGVGFEVSVLPRSKGLVRFAALNGLSPEELVLNGGEEYEIVGTVERSKLSEAVNRVQKAGGELMVIGRATEDKGKVLLRLNGATRRVPDEGWTHLS